MKNHFRYSILITLILMISISLVHAAPPIGQTTQPHPYESNPTAVSNFMVGAPLSTGKDAMKDGDLSSSGDFFLGAPHIIRPNGNSLVNTAWSESPSGLGYYVWKDESPNGETDYAYTSTVNAKETSTLEDPPTDASGTISSVTVYAVARKTTTASTTIRLMLRLGGVETFSSALTLTTSYALKSSVVARPGGGSWTWDDITSLEAGVQLYAAGTVRVTQLYVEIAGPTSAYLELNTFANTPATSFTIGFVDLKIKYQVDAALADDTYKIEYSTDGTIWGSLQSDTSAAYDRTAGAALRPWSQVAEPTDGIWDWADIGTLRIRVTATQNGGAWDAQKMILFEAWASVYPLPLPPTGSTHFAVIPSAIFQIKATQELFVDIYVTDVTEMAGYYLLLTFDTTILTPTSAMIYDPFHYTAPAQPELNDTEGWVILQQAMPLGESVGFTGSEPVARIYFTVDQWGNSELNIIDSTEFAQRTWPPGVSESKVKNIYAQVVTATINDGSVSAPRYLSFNGGILPHRNPTLLPNTWHELYPGYSRTWTLKSWVDNGDGYLSASDQIDMEIPGWVYWFHVDQVTVTIHFTYKLPDVGTGEAEPETPMTELPPVEPGVFPESSRWHMIYPEYSRMFTITSFEDNGVTPGQFDPSDQFDFIFDDTPETTHWAHLDSVSTDILVSQKGEPTETTPEFPLGIGVLMSLVALIPVVYTWRTRPKKKVA